MQKGQTLIEVLVALGVTIVIMTAVTVAVLTSLNNAQYSKLQNQATQYAQQGMEIVQSYRDVNSLAGTNGDYCMKESCSASDFTATGCFVTPPACNTSANMINGIFQRSLSISTDAAACGVGTDRHKVVVDVQWTDGKCTTGNPCHDVKVTSCMFDSLRSSF